MTEAARLVVVMALTLMMLDSAHAGDDIDPLGPAPAASAATAGSTNDQAQMPPVPPVPEHWALHGQLTNVTQGYRSFRSPYSGTNSLVADGPTEETTDLTLYAGVRLWPGAEFWVNPEVDQGFGLSDTLGVAGFPSGEAYKVGRNQPYLRLPRFFVRQVLALSSEESQIESAANQLAGGQPIDNVTLTLGKFSVVDIFDVNSYAHDPRANFLNWAIIDGGAFDYAADPWGFTYGAAAEWNQGRWTLRGGVFQLSELPNSEINGIEGGQYMLVAETEERHQWNGHLGKVKVLAFVNHARMARYSDAVELGAATGTVPDLALVRRPSTRAGAVLNLEQELISEVGVFARVSANDGSKETYEFTDINKSLALGLSAQGGRWGRHGDTVGLGTVVNGLSSDARSYLAAGGLGLLIGDGRLNYSSERIVEAYYAAALTTQVTVTLDYQYIRNPAYNQDRGPVSIFGLRVHAEF
jgi:high affinity Mn2+ porin